MGLQVRHSRSVTNSVSEDPTPNKESLNNLGWTGPLESSCGTSCPKHKQMTQNDLKGEGNTRSTLDHRENYSPRCRGGPFAATATLAFHNFWSGMIPEDGDKKDISFCSVLGSSLHHQRKGKRMHQTGANVIPDSMFLEGQLNT